MPQRGAATLYGHVRGLFVLFYLFNNNNILLLCFFANNIILILIIQIQHFRTTNSKRASITSRSSSISMYCGDGAAGGAAQPLHVA